MKLVTVNTLLPVIDNCDDTPKSTNQQSRVSSFSSHLLDYLKQLEKNGVPPAGGAIFGLNKLQSDAGNLKLNKWENPKIFACGSKVSMHYSKHDNARVYLTFMEANKISIKCTCKSIAPGHLFTCHHAWSGLSSLVYVCISFTLTYWKSIKSGTGISSRTYVKRCAQFFR